MRMLQIGFCVYRATASLARLDAAHFTYNYDCGTSGPYINYREVFARCDHCLSENRVKVDQKSFFSKLLIYLLNVSMRKGTYCESQYNVTFVDPFIIVVLSE